MSFRTDDTIWNEPSARKLYEDLERKLINELGAKKITIEGLSAQDIGKWIKAVRNISLPFTPDLQRIRQNSTGLPLLLDDRYSISLAAAMQICSGIYKPIAYYKPACCFKDGNS